MKRTSQVVPFYTQWVDENRDRLEHGLPKISFFHFARQSDHAEAFAEELKRQQSFHDAHGTTATLQALALTREKFDTVESLSDESAVVMQELMDYTSKFKNLFPHFDEDPVQLAALAAKYKAHCDGMAVLAQEFGELGRFRLKTAMLLNTTMRALRIAAVPELPAPEETLC